MSPLVAAGAALALALLANGTVLRVRNWHRPYLLAVVLVALTAAAAYLVLPRVTQASQSLLVPVAWVSGLSLLIKLAVLGRMRGLRLGAAAALLAWLLETVALVLLAAALLVGFLK